MKRLLWIPLVVLVTLAAVFGPGAWRRSHPVYSPEQAVRRYIEAYGQHWWAVAAHPADWQKWESRDWATYPQPPLPDAPHFLPAATLVRIGAADASGASGTVPVAFVLAYPGKGPPELGVNIEVRRFGPGWLVVDRPYVGGGPWSDSRPYDGSPIEGGEYPARRGEGRGP